MKEWWIFLGSACATVLALIKLVQIVMRSATKVFARAVDEHVAPIAQRVEQALSSLTSVMERVQADHERERDRTSERFTTVSKLIHENCDRLDSHAERIATVEGKLDIPRTTRGHINPQ